MKYFHF